MLGLLGDVTLVRLQVELVSAASQFLCRVVFDAQAAAVCGAVVGAHAKGVDVHLA